MPSRYSDSDRQKALQTFLSIDETISQLLNWNKNINSVENYYSSENGVMLLTANCTLITAIGEGLNRINRILPGFLNSTFSEIPWHSYISMRNHIAHGYFELDAFLVYDAIVNDFPKLQTIIRNAINLLKE